jgi:hypothetical protein
LNFKKSAVMTDCCSDDIIIWKRGPLIVQNSYTFLNMIVIMSLPYFTLLRAVTLYMYTGVWFNWYYEWIWFHFTYILAMLTFDKICLEFRYTHFNLCKVAHSMALSRALIFKNRSPLLKLSHYHKFTLSSAIPLSNTKNLYLSKGVIRWHKGGHDCVFLYLVRTRYYVETTSN